MNITIRRETKKDYAEVNNLVREAFWNLNTPGCNEHYLMHIMRTSSDFINELDFVAVDNEKIVGNIAYTHSGVLQPNGTTIPTITFGPISVLPEYQKQGIGTKLIKHTIEIAKSMGFNAIIILGDPAYYSKLGFKPAEEYNIKFGELYAAALQIYTLNETVMKNSSGSFVEGKIFECLEECNVDKFDESFPKKEKLITATQERFNQVCNMVHK